MIEENYVSFELAKMLNEKGFDEYCSHFYRVDGEHEYCYKAKLPRLTNNDIRNHDDWVNRVFACTCPTLQMAMTWLRKVHKLHIEFALNQDVQNEEAVIENYYFFNVSRLDRFANEGGDCKFYKSYEEAVEAGIKYCLENLI